MLDYVYNEDRFVVPWVAALIPAVGARGFGRCTSIGVVDGQNLVAGFVYHDWNPDAGVMQISGAALPGARWCTQQTLAHVYRYPFLGAGCQEIYQMISATDERLLRQLAALNYSFLRIPRLLGRDQDAVLALLTFEAWASNKLCKRYHHHILEQKEAA